MSENTELSTQELKDAEAAYGKMASAAALLDPMQIVPLRADPILALHNVRRGMSAVQPRQSELNGVLSETERRAVADLETLALALVFSSLAVNKMLGRSTGEVGEKLQRARKLRRILLLAAESCAEADLLPPAEVEKIRRGKGNIDTAQDCIDLAALYRRHAQVLEGKTPATAALVDESAQLGTELVIQLKPAAARPDPALHAAVQEAATRRNRVWTLLTRAHETLWKAGAYLYGKQVEDHVPSLQARKRTAAAKSTPAKPANASA